MNIKRIIIWAFLVTASIRMQAQGTFVIEGQVENIKKGVCLNLFKMENGVGNSVAVDSLRGDTFRFELPVSSDDGIERMTLIIQDDDLYSMGLQLWANAGSHIRLTGKDMNIYTWQVESEVPTQKIWQLFVEDSRPLWDLYQVNHIEQMRHNHTCRRINPTGQERVRAIAIRDSLEKIGDDLCVRISANEIVRMKQLPIEEVWMDKLYSLAIGVKYSKGFPYRKEVEQLYNMLSDEQRQTSKVLDIQTLLMPPETVSLEEKTADGDLFDLQGKVHHLSIFKGKPVLIDFWSRGCGPCLMALPEMEEISKKYEGRLVLVSLSIDDKTGWEIASRHHKITWWNLNDLKGQHGIYAKYTSGSIPRYVFLSPEGEVVEMWSGYGKGSLLKKLEKLMK